MRYGYWLPVFGGWLRNVEDEQMEATWEYASRLARRSEEIGFDLTLIAELNLNDIKGADAPALDAWSTAAALVYRGGLGSGDKTPRVNGRRPSHVPFARAPGQTSGEHRPHCRSGPSFSKCCLILVGG